MKKLFVTFLLLIAIGAGGVYFYANTLIKRAIEVQGSKITGSTVTLASSNVELFSGKGTLKGLQISNPDGFVSDYAFYMDEVSIAMQPKTLLENTIIIDKILVNLPRISYEINTAGNNISVLQNRIAKNTSSGGGSAGAEKSKKPAKKILIKDLLLKGGTVNVVLNSFGSATKQEVALPDIHLTNISSDGEGVSSEKLAVLIMAAVQKNLLKVNLNNLGRNIEDLGKGAGDGIKKTLDDADKSIRNFLGR